MGPATGAITTFIVEPFMPHKDEYYLSITSARLGADVIFSECGGWTSRRTGTRYCGR